MTKTVCRFSWKVSVILVGFWRTFNFVDGLSKNAKISSFYKKSVQWEPNCSTRIDRQTNKLTNEH